MSQRNRRITEMVAMGIKRGEPQVTEQAASQDKPGTGKKKADFSRFVKLLEEKASAGKDKILSENGALEYSTTGSALVDFNARATEFRNAGEKIIMEAALRAYAEDPVSFVKLMFQTGDIRGGKGERHVFNTCMDWMVAEHPFVASQLLSLIPEYTRWDYLIRQTVSSDSEVSRNATELVSEQFKKDLQAVKHPDKDGNARVSLLGKWMPSLQTKKADDRKVVRHLLKALHMQERDYRKALSELRQHLNVIEKFMSAKEYDSIDMEKLSSKQQLRYSDFFTRVMEQRRHEYIQAVLRGEKKMNASVLNPIEIVHEYSKKSCRDKNSYYGYNQRIKYDEDMEALWSILPDRTSGNGNTLVVRDGSGSMTSPIGQGSSATMLEAASAMAIYCADHMKGAFGNKFITFSSNPRMVSLDGCRTLAEKLNILARYDECSNTDIEATFDLVLDAAVSGGLKQEELPSYIMILSDMEFDVARGARGFYDWDTCSYFPSNDRDTLFDTIRKKWNEDGYELPTLVFWQLNGARTIYPEIDSRNGIIFLSGFSTNELELVMAGKYEAVEEVTEEVQTVDEETGEEVTVTKTVEKKVILSPKEQLELKLSDPRYDAVETAVRKGLEIEKAGK